MGTQPIIEIFNPCKFDQIATVNAQYDPLFST